VQFYRQKPIADYIADFAVGVSHVEIWKFKTPELNLDQSSAEFRFAVFYNNLDSGEWFWDNNFGQNYSLSKTDLANID
jgi:hypothetical protein